MTSAEACYYPDGSVAALDTPCHSSSTGGGASACCTYPDICLDNKLCLAQGGVSDAAVISRGSCTDQTWKSSGCSQYCADVDPSGYAFVHLYEMNPNPVFCCSPVDSLNNTCVDITKGSAVPFFVPAGHVIFNRTSGSTSPNITNTATVTVTATTPALALTSNSSSVHVASSSSSSPSSPSNEEVAIGAGMGVPLGLALLVTLGLLWRQRIYKQSLERDVQTWEGRYRELAKDKLVNVGGSKYQQPHELLDWHSDQLDCQPSELTYQLEG